MFSEILGSIAQLVRDFDLPQSSRSQLAPYIDTNRPTSSKAVARIVERSSLAARFAPREGDWLLPDKRRDIEAWRRNVAEPVLHLREPIACSGSVALSASQGPLLARAPLPIDDGQSPGARRIRVLLSCDVADEVYVFVCQGPGQTLTVPSALYRSVAGNKLDEELWQLLAEKLGSEADLLVSALVCGFRGIFQVGGPDLTTSAWLKDLRVFGLRCDAIDQSKEGQDAQVFFGLHINRLNALPHLHASANSKPRWVTLKLLSKQLAQDPPKSISRGQKEFFVTLDDEPLMLDADTGLAVQNFAHQLGERI